MTKEEILAMEAGRELDALVAEELMDWEIITEDDEQPDQVPYLVSRKEHQVYYPKVAAQFPEVYPAVGLLPYSTDISAAWQVWLAVTKDAPYAWAIYSSGTNGEVSVEHYPDDYLGELEAGCGDFSVEGALPEAICKAALIQNIRKEKD